MTLKGECDGIPPVVPSIVIVVELALATDEAPLARAAEMASTKLFFINGNNALFIKGVLNFILPAVN